MFSRLNATNKVTNPTTTEVTTKEFSVARSVRFGMAQSAFRGDDVRQGLFAGLVDVQRKMPRADRRC